MPLVGVNNEPLLERAVFGYDGTNYRVVSVNGSGQLVAAIASGQIVEARQSDDTLLKATVAVKADQNIQARNYGYDGTTWRKLPLLFGVSDVVALQWSNTNLSAGSNNVDSSAVPAGEIWVITAANISFTSTTINFGAMRLVHGAVPPFMMVANAPLAVTVNLTTGWWVAMAGDSFRIQVNNATAGDDAFGEVLGFKIAIS